jgi:hypothetical protein
VGGYERGSSAVVRDVGAGSLESLSGVVSWALAARGAPPASRATRARAVAIWAGERVSSASWVCSSLCINE